jgi:hypothetical protein
MTTPSMDRSTRIAPQNGASSWKAIDGGSGGVARQPAAQTITARETRASLILTT